MNEKQLKYSKLKVETAKAAARVKFVAFLFIAFMAAAFAMGIADGSFSMADIIGQTATGGVGMALMATVGNIAESSNTERSGKQVKGRLWILEYSQFDDEAGFPARTGITVGSIPLKAGEKWHYIDTVEDSPEPKSAGELGDVAATITNTITFMVGGMPEGLVLLLEGGIGKRFFVVWQQCNSQQKWIAGDGCKPMKLKSFDGGAGKDYTGFEITFENEGNRMYSKYSGTLVTAEPTTVAADATAITYSSAAQQYQLTSGTSAAAGITAVNGLSATDDGKVIDILGSGGTYPSTISASSVFILANGTQWVANAGSSISFRVMKSGASTYSLIEVSRVQTA